MNKMSLTTPYSTTTKVLGHLLLWLFIYTSYTLMASPSGRYGVFLRLNAVNVPLFMLAYYTLRYLQIPYLYNRGKKVLFILSLIGSSLLLYGIYTAVWLIWLGPALGHKPGRVPFLGVSYFFVKAIRFYSPALVLLTLEFLREGRREQNRILQLEKEKMANELKFLKAQINPHFLFNTLNNLYSYVVTQSPKAPDMILRLSGILDYVFNKSHNKTLPLQDEVTTIEHFLELEQIRYGDRLQVDYKTEGNMSLPVSPLILLSIVENAFKHGASGDINTPKIKIDITGKSNAIHCEVWNTKSKHQGELNDAYKKGIGLSNIKRQLNLIYPHNHRLVIDDQDESFNVSLSITPHHE